MKIINDNIIINIKVCNNFLNKFKGFMFKKNIDTPLCFPKCNSIHTFFMLKPIDIIMTDKDFNILYIYKNFKPWHIIWFKRNVYYTFEFPINKYKFNINEKIKVS